MRAFLILAALLLGHCTLFAAEENGETLAKQLRGFAQQYGFVLVGADKASDSEAISKLPEGDPARQVKTLMLGYDYVAIQPPGGKLEKIIIIGKKNSAPAPSIVDASGDPNADPDGDVVIPTERQDAHHLVLVTVYSDVGEEFQSSLMVDTGASLVVLPRSAADELEIPEEELQERDVQTAKGRLKASVTRAPMIQIGPLEIPNVEVAFIEDEMLGGQGLLGMNVLGRYRFTLDDDQNTLTLSPKR